MDAIVYDKVGKEAEKVRDALYGIYPQETITNAAIASFDDGADGIPVKALTVGIEPVQDLHGYDHPWPGGGNVNKFGDYTVVNGYIPSSGIITSAAGNKTYIMPIEPGTAYGLKIVRTSTTGDPADDDVQVAEYYSENRPIVNETVGTRLAGYGYVDNLFRYAFTTSENAKWLAIKIGNTNKTDVEATVATVQLEKGSSAPTTPYTPYENLCPISGHTGAEIEQAGKNLLIKTETAYISPNDDYAVYLTGSGTSLFFNCVKGQTYTVSGLSINRGNYAIFDHLPTASERTTVQGRLTAVNNVLTFTAQKSGVCVVYANNETVDTSAAQIELGSTPTVYEPYHGNQISVTFPETIYGGEDEVIGGKLKKTMGIVDLGSLTWYKNTNTNVFSAPVAGKLAGNFNLICSVYPVSTGETIALMPNKSIKGHATTGDIYIKDDSYNAEWSSGDVASFKAAMSGVQLVYELAEPVEYTLTPQTLPTLYGTNNVWADTGNIEKLTYRADLGKYIDSHITTAVANALNA